MNVTVNLEIQDINSSVIIISIVYKTFYTVKGAFKLSQIVNLDLGVVAMEK